MKEMLKKVLGFIVFDIVQTVVVALAIFAIVYIFIASPHVIVGHSMDTSFANGEFVLVNKFLYHFEEPQRGDVIIFKYSPTADYIKRIIGLPGDSVELIGGYVYVNGKKLQESAYINPGNLSYGLDFLANNKKIIVPINHYFVMGDNREESSDSREWGFVDKNAIDGKVFLVYWPANEIEIVPSVHYTVEGNELVATKD